MIFSGFSALVALTRTGISTFWATMSDAPAAVRVIEIAPILLLLSLTVVMTIMAGPVMDYMYAMADSLHTPSIEIGNILATPVVVETAP